jgi:hypothetical protein
MIDDRLTQQVTLADLARLVTVEPDFDSHWRLVVDCNGTCVIFGS